jgi:ATP-binding cassette, subfamily C (CFTR/MRP), member 1
MAPSDDHFGPQVPGVFDFTILFEQSILSLLPTALFIVIAPLRVFPLLSREKRVRPGPLLWAKLVNLVSPAAPSLCLLST